MALKTRILRSRSLTGAPVDALGQLGGPSGGDVPARNRQVLLRPLQDRYTGQFDSMCDLLNEMAGSHDRVESRLDSGASGRPSFQT